MTAWPDITEDDSPALEDIEFLARSPHRIEVLGALADAPRTRHELKERADVSRVTISRLLDDLENVVERQPIDRVEDILIPSELVNEPTTP